MYCRKCGTLNQDNAYKCVQCGEILQTGPVTGIGGTPPPKIQNYLIHSILAALLCCPPTGVAGIVYAAQVNTRIQAGDMQGALASSQKARMWFWISVIVGVVVNVIGLIVLTIVGLGSLNQH